MKILWGAARTKALVAWQQSTERSMSQANNLRRCHTTFDQDTSLIAVVEMSQSSWLVAGIVPGISRQPANKIKPDQTVLLGLLRCWQGERIGPMQTRCARGEVFSSWPISAIQRGIEGSVVNIPTVHRLLLAKSPLFRSALGRTGLLNGAAMHRVDAYRMIQRQRRATKLGMK